MNGYVGKVLRINLTTKEVRKRFKLRVSSKIYWCKGIRS